VSDSQTSDSVAAGELQRSKANSRLFVFSFRKLESSSCNRAPTVGWQNSTTGARQARWVTCRWARGNSTLTDTTGGKHTASLLYLYRSGPHVRVRRDLDRALLTQVRLTAECCLCSQTRAGHGPRRQHGTRSSSAQHDAFWCRHRDVLAQPPSATATVSTHTECYDRSVLKEKSELLKDSPC